MTKKISVTHRLRSATFLSFILLFITMAIGSVYAAPGSSPEGLDPVAAKMEMIRTHVQKNGNQDPEMADRLRQLEEKFRAGASLKEGCQFCHADKVTGHRPAMPSRPAHSGPSRWGGEDER